MMAPHELPKAVDARFKPLRSGLLNLFKYENQQFWYERGRLLVRGNNGSGKSRVLALQLPFLLDGEISPSRVEPDGDRVRQLAWHLHMDVHDQRTGYTWIEFGRKDETGAEVYLTLGCGMKAVRNADNQPTRWFFITEKRVDRDFDFLDGARPLNAEQLTEILGDRCFFKTLREYRREIDARMFGLGEERYRALIELLIRLRAPQLAKKLEEKTLYAALSEALSPIDEDLVAKVAAAFRDLDDLRTQHSSLLSLASVVTEFQGDYRRYSQGVVGRRAAVVRTTHSEYERAQRAIADLERQLNAARGEEAERKEALRLAREAFLEATTRYETLLQSREADDAQKLDLAKSAYDQGQTTAHKAEEAAIRAQDAAAASSQEVEAQQGVFDSAANSLGVELRKARAAANDAAFAGEHERLLAGAAEAWPVQAPTLLGLRSAHGKAADAHLQRLSQIESRLKTLEDARMTLVGAEDAESRASNEVERLAELTRTHDKSARDSGEKLKKDYVAWHSSLRWLNPEPWDEFASVFEEWLESAADDQRVLHRVLEKAASSEAAAQAGREKELEARTTLLAAERLTYEQEKARLSAGSPPPPESPATRDSSSRIGRVGAPLWQACEFSAFLDAGQRAGLEAALEASGLLDAWVSPEGLQVPGTPADTFIEAIEYIASDEKCLADWLVPDLPDAAVRGGLTGDHVQHVLRGIGGTEGARSQHWVALDGRWRLGPIFGRGEKSVAQHLGATSREAARRDRLAQIEAALRDIEVREVALAGDMEALATRVRDSQAERVRAPSDAAIAELLVFRTVAGRDLSMAREGLRKAQSSAVSVREAVDEARMTMEREARDLGYGDHLHRLSELRASWHPYALTVAEVWPAAERRAMAAAHLGQMQSRRSRDDEAAAQARQNAAETRATLIEAETTYKTLLERVGATIEEFLQQKSAARSARDAAEKAETDAGNALGTASEKRANLEGQEAPAKDAQNAAYRAREQAIADLRIPMHHGLFSEAHDDFLDTDRGAWSVAQAVDIARRIDRTIPGAALGDPEWTHLQNDLQVRLNDLQTRAGSLGCRVRSEIVAPELAIVICTFHGTDHTPGSLGVAVAAELAAHERLLNDRERGIIETHLVSEVSVQLQNLINAARERTDLINGELTRCATTLGFTLRLVWEPVAERVSSDGQSTEGLPAGLAKVRDLILADHGAWTDEERKLVGNFLHQLIRDERAKDSAASWAEHLGRALDYRKWHAFGAQRRQNGRWERLNRQRYGTGSGGEKALMLTIPQMAAAASHYHSAAAHSPRLILLDEAFAGMDKPTRARCLGLLEPGAFDLDLLMTSEREWGAHDTVSAMAIYQLVADTEAIFATRWIWNGRQRLLAPVPDTPELRANSQIAVAVAPRST